MIWEHYSTRVGHLVLALYKLESSNPFFQLVYEYLDDCGVPNRQYCDINGKCRTYDYPMDLIAVSDSELLTFIKE